MSGQKRLLINTAGVEKVYNLFHLFHACSAIYIYGDTDIIGRSAR